MEVRAPLPQVDGGPPVVDDVLDDLAVVLRSGYEVEDTFWRGRRIRRLVTQVDPGERSSGSSVSGWWLPPRWLLPRDHLTAHRSRFSYADLEGAAGGPGL